MIVDPGTRSGDTRSFYNSSPKPGEYGGSRDGSSFKFEEDRNGSYKSTSRHVDRLVIIIR
jgi:hypothetical protein